MKHLSALSVTAQVWCLLLPAPLAKSHRKGLSDLLTDKSAPGLTDLAHDDMSDSIQVNCTCAWHDVANMGAELQNIYNYSTWHPAILDMTVRLCIA